MTMHLCSVYGTGGMKHQNLHWPSIQYFTEPLLSVLPCFYCKYCLLLHSVLTFKIIIVMALLKHLYPNSGRSTPLLINHLHCSSYCLWHFPVSNQSRLLIFILLPQLFTSLKENQSLHFCRHLLQPSRTLRLPDHPNWSHLLCSFDYLLSYLTPLVLKAILQTLFTSCLFSPISYTPMHARWNGCPDRESSILNKIHKICKFCKNHFVVCIALNRKPISKVYHFPT